MSFFFAYHEKFKCCIFGGTNYICLIRNGDTYAGEYFADKMHGFGIYHFANGHRYEGAWHEGRRQGLGMYTFRNGETQSGHWQNGVLDIPSTQSTTYPVSPVGVNHSRVLNAVQVHSTFYDLVYLNILLNIISQCIIKEQRSRHRIVWVIFMSMA